MSKAPAYVGLFVINGSGSPVGLLDNFLGPVKKSWQTFDETRRANCSLAGLDGFCLWASGVDRRGIDMSIKIATAVRDGRGYVLMVGSPRQNAAGFTPDLNRIEQSVSLGTNVSLAAARPQGSAADQLAALDKAYQEGTLTTDEYEARKRALSGQCGAPSAPAPAPPPAQTQPQQRTVPTQAPPAQVQPPAYTVPAQVPVQAQPRADTGPAQAPAPERPLPTQAARVPFGARVFIAPMEGGLDGYIAPEILKNRVPVVIVTDEKDADYILTGNSTKADDKWYHTVFGGKDKNEGNVRMLSVKERQLVWAGEAGDRSLWWGNLKRGGQRKVAERIVKQMNRDLFRK